MPCQFLIYTLILTIHTQIEAKEQYTSHLQKKKIVHLFTTLLTDGKGQKLVNKTATYNHT